MKKLLLLLVLVVPMFMSSCKKEDKETVNTIRTIHFTVENLPSDAMYVVTLDQTRPESKSLLNIQAGDTNKTYDIQVNSKTGLAFFWQFGTKDKKYKSEGKITIKLDDATLHTVSGYGGSYVFTTP